MVIDKLKIKIRKIEAPDIGLMTKYRIAYLAEMQGERDEEFIRTLRKELSEYFMNAIREGRVLAFVAEAEGEMVSFGALVIKQIPGDFNKSSYLEGDVLNMYTIPEARRMGISSMILERLIEEARNMGISKLALHTSKKGEQLYRRFGFADPVYPVLELNLE